MLNKPHACQGVCQHIHRLLVLWLQAPTQQLHPLAANSAQRLPLHMQLNGHAGLAARPQAFSSGLANATYIPGTGLQYGGGGPHLQQRAAIASHAPDAPYGQQDHNALAAAAAATNAAIYKRNAGLPPHIQQQLMRGQQVLPNQPAPRPPNGLLFETNDIDLSGTHIVWYADGLDVQCLSHELSSLASVVATLHAMQCSRYCMTAFHISVCWLVSWLLHPVTCGQALT